MNYIRIKLQFFLLKNQFLLQVLFHLILVYLLSDVSITLCADGDGCWRAYHKSIQNIEATKQQETLGRFNPMRIPQKIQEVVLGGNEVRFGSGSVIEGDKVYTVQTVEHRKYGVLVRRLSDCMATKKPE